MEKKIKSITEAFSMQPRTWYVCDERLPFTPDTEIAEVKLERTGPDQFYDFLYRAYNFDEQIIFEWQPKAVNVEYY